MKSFQKKLLSHIFLTVVVVSIALPGVAQAGRLELKNLEKLADRAAEVQDVTLDGSLLQLAVSVMKSSGDPDAAQVVEVIKGLKGIYIKNFEFDSPGQYSQADVESIRSQLTGPGWQRIVTSYTKRSGERDEVYLLKDGDKINGITVLVAEARELTVVNIVGAIDPEKLGELGGHFGIPDQIKEQSKPKLVPRKDGVKGSSANPETRKESGHDDQME
ncbi:MAG TPA: DUF4252 domain-containing protein [Candidatus Angelobacter sp.]|jgi:hypothetical protein|nr:DUF4252 domain-containing protein [Candidatus Angelobacter sp.]